MNAPAPPSSWGPLLVNEAPAVRALADAAHPGLPERLEVFVERIQLFPEGCRKLVHRGVLGAYGIAHPARIGAPPPLDTLLSALPADADCLHLHDIVVTPVLRGAGASAGYVEAMAAVARAHRFDTMTMVAVHGTHLLWRRLGFVERALTPAPGKIASYGPAARYLVRPL